jgi:transcriptional regulator of acetoin/glycerol metabolism
VKLLRVLETGEIHPLGTAAKHRVDVRVVAAVQDGITADVEAGRFRRDLYQRVAGVVITLPSLAARPEDVVPLADHFAGLQHQRLELGAERVLLDYAWPGNVRELRQVIERAGRLVSNGTLPPAALAEAIHLGAPETFPETRDAADLRSVATERSRLLLACEAHGWNADRVARDWGIHRATLFRRLKRAGISLRHLRESQKSHASRATPCDFATFVDPPTP